jgi:hypothetical protein
MSISTILLIGLIKLGFKRSSISINTSNSYLVEDGSPPFATGSRDEGWLSSTLSSGTTGSLLKERLPSSLDSVTLLSGLIRLRFYVSILIRRISLSISAKFISNPGNSMKLDFVKTLLFYMLEFKLSKRFFTYLYPTSFVNDYFI